MRRVPNMKIWKNTSTLDGYDDGLTFTEDKEQADVALLGSKPINLEEFPVLKGIFRVGIGKDNVPEKAATNKGILVRFPRTETIDIIYNETAAFTCSLIFRMLYDNVGTIYPWVKNVRVRLKDKVLLVIGTGNIGMRVVTNMKRFMNVITFEILENDIEELPDKISQADCISLHISKTQDNKNFFDLEKLAFMKDNAILINTARGTIVDEDALYNELSAGRLRAAFDVFWQEPYNGKLMEYHPARFFMTPHVASTCSGFLAGCRKGLDELTQELRHV